MSKVIQSPPDLDLFTPPSYHSYITTKSICYKQIIIPWARHAVCNNLQNSSETSPTEGTALTASWTNTVNSFLFFAKAPPPHVILPLPACRNLSAS